MRKFFSHISDFKKINQSFQGLNNGSSQNTTSSANIANGTVSTGQTSSITNINIQNIQTSVTNLQNIFNAGTNQGADAVIQSLISQLTEILSRVGPNAQARQSLDSMIKNLDSLHQRSISGSLNMSTSANVVTNIVNQTNLLIQVKHTESQQLHISTFEKMNLRFIATFRTKFF